MCLSSNVELFFNFPPVFSSVKPKKGHGSSPDPISIAVGEPFKLNCTAHSNPSPAYSWTGPDNTTVGNGSDFSVQSAGFEHKGLYVCAARNSQGSATVKFNVDIGGVFNVFNLSASEAHPFLILQTWSSFLVRHAPTLIVHSAVGF